MPSDVAMSNDGLSRRVSRFAPKAIALLTTAFLLALLAAGCDPGEDISYRNETDEVLFATVNDGGRNRLPPMSDHTLSYIWSRFGEDDDPLTIVVADERGCIVRRVVTTLRRFREELDMTLVINPTHLPPPAERTDCDPNLAD